MDERLSDVIVVGGGDLGLLAALGIRKLNPGMDVSVIDDFDQEPPKVGKSTYREILPILHGTLGIDEREFVANVRPIWKASVYFRDWCGRPEFHYPFDVDTKFPDADTPDAIEHYYHYYEELQDSPDHLTTGEQIVTQRKSPWHFDASGDLDRYDKVAYHLDTDRFNSYLREICRDRGISLVDDKITTVETTDNHIDGIRSKRQRYEADLYVDATGFERVLRREQDVAFRDFEFPLDSALNVRLERPLSDVIPATIVESADYGWFWHIDTYDNRDLGYVYASEYVDESTAREEFLEYVGDVAPDTAEEPPVSAADIESYPFDSGYYERAWVDNCLTVGNAAGFVEPLQSTGLTANAAAAMRVANLLSSHGRIADDSIREAYNDWVGRLWESIYDFISIHYAYADGETAFWEAMSSRAVSPRVEWVETQFDQNGFDWSINLFATAEGVTPLHTFLPPDFHEMMRNLGATSTFYETHDFSVSDDVKRHQESFYADRREEVEEYLTAEELYKGMLNL